MAPGDCQAESRRCHLVTVPRAVAAPRGHPTDRDLYRLSSDESAELPKTPGTLDDAHKALESDHEFLLKDDVFTEGVIQTWIEHKRRHEVDAFRLRPHPYEFCLYFDA